MMPNARCAALSRQLLCFFALLLAAMPLRAQEEDLLEQLQADEPDAPVSSTFNTSRLINLHTSEVSGRNVLEFRITHRFGTVGSGFQGFYGLDNSADIRIGFDYGITDRLLVGIGRNKISKRFDGFAKYQLLRQTRKKVPVSLTVLGSAGYDPTENFEFSLGDQTGYEAYPDFASRWTYYTQAIIARKFHPRFSFQLAPTFLYRNYVGTYSYDYFTEEVGNNGQTEINTRAFPNAVFALGAGARFGISQMVTITADYMLPFTDYLLDRPDNVLSYYPPLGIGVELEVGGHIFLINATNSEAIWTGQAIMNSPTWFTEEGGYRLGFCIVRVFTPGKRIVKRKDGADEPRRKQRRINPEE